MLEVKKLGKVLEPTSLDFESEAVLNPAVYQDGRTVHMFYRAIDSEHRSCIGYARLDGPTEIVERWDHPIITREESYESQGVEDPRIVKIGTTFYMTYVAHDGKNAVTAYATASDILKFQKRGVISPRFTYHEAAQIFKKSQLKDAYSLFEAFYEEGAGEDVLVWHKDVILYPKKIEGMFTMLHRILPDIQIVQFKDFTELTDEFWRNYLEHLSDNVILENKHWFETRNLGGGAPPIETKDGWLLIIHTVEETNRGRIYHAGAALFDKKDPKKLIGKLHEPLFSPVEEWERSGFVSNVVFPTGTALFDDTLYIYYGAADKRIAVASVKLKDLIDEIKSPVMVHAHI